MYKTRTYTNITNENRRKIQELLNDNSNISIMGIAEQLEIEYSTITGRLNVELMLMDIMTLIMLKKNMMKGTREKADLKDSWIRIQNCINI